LTAKRTGIVAAVVIVIALIIAGIGWAAWWVNDNIDAPGPGATGSGPCSSADSVNIRMVFADGHRAGVHPRSARLSESDHQRKRQWPDHQRIGVRPRQSAPQLGTPVHLLPPLRRRAPGEASEQTLTLTPGPWMMPGAQASPTLSSAHLSVTPRDPLSDAYLTESGSLTVSSSHGVARGRIDGTFSGHGPTRTDRPAPSAATVSPLSITGMFACSH